MKSLTCSITTLLFDWDGTLFDSATAGRIAFQKTFDDLDVAFTQEFYEQRYSPNWYAMYEAGSYPTSKHLLNERPDIHLDSISGLLLHF